MEMKYNPKEKWVNETHSFFVYVCIERINWYNFFEDNLEILSKVSKAYSFWLSTCTIRNFTKVGGQVGKNVHFSIVGENKTPKAT